jgi:hypothetical protein
MGWGDRVKEKQRLRGWKPRDWFIAKGFWVIESKVDVLKEQEAQFVPFRVGKSTGRLKSGWYLRLSLTENKSALTRLHPVSTRIAVPVSPDSGLPSSNMVDHR